MQNWKKSLISSLENPERAQNVKSWFPPEFRIGSSRFLLTPSWTSKTWQKCCFFSFDETHLWLLETVIHSKNKNTSLTPLYLLSVLLTICQNHSHPASKIALHCSRRKLDGINPDPSLNCSYQVSPVPYSSTVANWVALFSWLHVLIHW